MEKQNHAARHAFFYMLSLVALIIMSLSSGTIIFQIINKTIVDLLNEYSGRFSLTGLKFSISALLISAPLYFLTMKKIHKSLFEGDLKKDSEIRKWLTYFVLLVSAVVMIGWLIGVVNSFLGGEMTSKFALKALTALGIATTIFSFYFYDIKRDDVKGKKDKIVCAFAYSTLLAVIIVFVASLFAVESPQATRNRKLDLRTRDNFNGIHRGIENYYQDFKKLPADLTIVQSEYDYMQDRIFKNISTGKLIEYKVVGDREFELCTDFLASNKEMEELDRWSVSQNGWLHDTGYQCLKKKVRKLDDLSEKEMIMMKERIME